MSGKRGLWVALLVFGMATVASAATGPLWNHASAYDDGTTVWHGSTPFDSIEWGGTGDLAGHVEWAVFGPGDFPFLGYSVPSGEFAYTYQVFIEGVAPGSSFSVKLTNPADTIGWFSLLSGVNPSSMTLTPLSSAKWIFNPTIPGSGGISAGLVYASPKKPKELYGAMVDTGESSYVIPLPSPSANDIPEPAAVSLLALGCLALFRRSR